MGILRADRVSGLGGANAIKGSVFYKGKSFIKVEPDSSFTLGTGDYTVEAWVYSERSYGGVFHLFDSDIMDGSNDSGPGFGAVVSDGQWNSYYGSGSIIDSGVTMKRSVWQHVALVRYSGTTKIYVNGTSIASQSDSTNYTSSMIYPVIGGWWNNDYNWQGYISNFRFVVGTAVYQSNFTPPTSELTAIDGTQILCFQTSDILREETGKTLFIDGESNNNAPIASRFTPNSPVGFSTTTDVGTQFGSTFDGVTTFDSQAYFVPPGGNTRERNRGRAIMAGGMAYPTANTNIIEMLEIQSGGMTQDFGDLITKTSTSGPVSSSTRGVIVSGLAPSARTNAIEFVTIANTGNATDFGDYVGLLGYVGGVSNETRGVTCGGSGPSSPTGTDQMAYITIATAGDATNFGDLSGNAQGAMGVQSSTRGVFNLGYAGGFVNTIEYITIASTGDTTSFGTLSRTNSAFGGSCCGSTRGLFAGGYNNTPAPATEVNNIDYITIASTGDSVDFGDLVTPGFYNFGTSNKIRGIFQGRLTTAPYTGDPMIDSVTIATLGNAVEWGEMYRMDSGPHDGQALVRRGATSVSDSHGGV